MHTIWAAVWSQHSWPHCPYLSLPGLFFPRYVRKLFFLGGGSYPQRRCFQIFWPEVPPAWIVYCHYRSSFFPRKQWSFWMKVLCVKFWFFFYLIIARSSLQRHFLQKQRVAASWLFAGMAPIFFKCLVKRGMWTRGLGLTMAVGPCLFDREPLERTATSETLYFALPYVEI